MITREDVRRVAWLSSVELEDSELDEYCRKLGLVLEYFGVLDEVVEDVDPTYHVLEIDNVFRDDVACEMLSQRDALMNACETKDGYFKSARIV
ncbi:Aspartyl/glutamyl-tRNA(Asn/Gln) amidotransferasesubunit C [Candidatus Methanoperedenaceae archaeon GB50]|nr:Aspartyl/glutamyl-tRNA(Asn/Gln) amidotransferasesubunit C [Candidatus Methanoperedenaceae archaeon GB37]CAD7774681.1 Aspartyl/glutamyl-tRNA(Asn/Gln) amidotransferasesubunit C [Candidatus Methanoperedenaceae archaeon GB50]CAD7780664.1 MAG: Aspartyl/glutamyl-tRNA(Asn/Gln) amidotransferasesubunit C [Candidatus Methanoperedenaceae archaeon GB50]